MGEVDASSAPIAFAAAKRKKTSNKKKGNSSTVKGFGAPPPTLDDVLSKFPSRVPKEDAADQTCPCGTKGLTYGECCGPLHKGEQSCQSMMDVLRSRYSAFCWRNIQYVIETTHESCRDYRDDRIAWAKDLHKNGMFDSFAFVKLEVLGEEEISTTDPNEGFLDFQVTLRDLEDGQETIVSERSKFLRNPETLTWSYASGDVRSEVAGLEDTTLNP